MFFSDGSSCSPFFFWDVEDHFFSFQQQGAWFPPPSDSRFPCKWRSYRSSLPPLLMKKMAWTDWFFRVLFKGSFHRDLFFGRQTPLFLLSLRIRGSSWLWLSPPRAGIYPLLFFLRSKAYLFFFLDFRTSLAVDFSLPFSFRRHVDALRYSGWTFLSGPQKQALVRVS